MSHDSALARRFTPILPKMATPAWRRWWLLGVATLGWDGLGQDLWVMDRLAGPGGFAWRHGVWLEHWAHDGARVAMAVAYGGLCLAALLVVWRRGWRSAGAWRWLEAATGVTLCLAAIALLKRHSLTSCPWDLELYGGVARHVSHWAWGQTDGGPGRCFPGGHASAALGFWPVALAWAPRSAPGTVAPRLWGWIGVLGVVFGAVQTVRGAHYPSHTLWTAWLCWTVALLHHGAWRGLSAGHSPP